MLELREEQMVNDRLGSEGWRSGSQRVRLGWHWDKVDIRLFCCPGNWLSRAVAHIQNHYEFVEVEIQSRSYRAWVDSDDTMIVHRHAILVVRDSQTERRKTRNGHMSYLLAGRHMSFGFHIDCSANPHTTADSHADRTMNLAHRTVVATNMTSSSDILAGNDNPEVVVAAGHRRNNFD